MSKSNQQKSPAESKYRKSLLCGSIFFFAFCFIGCMLQSVSISNIYLRYDASNTLTMTIPSKLEAPDLSICFRYFDIINMTALNEDKNATLNSHRNRVNTEKLQELVTVQDIFDYTPPVDRGLFHSCIYRVPGRFSYKEAVGEGCYDVFQVRNFYIQEYICYRFTLTIAVDKVYEYAYLAYALYYQGIFFQLEFNLKTFKEANTMKLVVHPSSSFPISQMGYSSYFRREYDRATELASYNLFDIVYTTLTTTRLEAPYKTDCFNYNKIGFNSKSACFSNCLIDHTLNQTGKYPFSISIIDETHLENGTAFQDGMAKDAAHVNVRDVTNSTYEAALITLENVCQRKCDRPDCSEVRILTKTVFEPLDGTMRFDVNAPRESVYAIDFHPRMSFTEYAIQVFSVFGTWFGLSLIHLNPLDWEFFHKGLTKKQATKANSVISKLRRKKSKSSIKINDKFGFMHEKYFCDFCDQTRKGIKKEMKAGLDNLSRLAMQREMDAN